MTDLLQRIEQNLRDRRRLQRGQAIMVAVSGGADSMVLLHALQKLSARHQWKITVAHFNHRLRGRAGDADERLVRAAAAELKLPFVAGRADVKGFSKRSRLSIEMAARKLRHEFLAREAAGRKIKTIALAHHADDQVELFFLRLLRGAGGEGLAGMKWRSPSPVDGGVMLVRPLLNFTKAELAAFAREGKIRFRNDATNFSNDFLRNRIRNELLPLLRQKYQPGLTKTVLRLMEIIGAESDIVGEAAGRWFQKTRSSRGNEAQIKSGKRKAESGNKSEPPHVGCYNFDKLPVAIQRRVLQLQLVKLGVAADFDLIESLRQSADLPVSIARNLSVSRNAVGAVELRSHLPAEFNADGLEVDLLDRAGEVDFGGAKFRWQFCAGANPVGRSPHQVQAEFFDADKIGGKIRLRHWRPGDRFQPIGLKSAAKLQDLFVNAKIPREQRRNLVVAEVGGGGIFWVDGLRIGEKFKLTPKTARTLVWSRQKTAV